MLLEAGNRSGSCVVAVFAYIPWRIFVERVAQPRQGVESYCWLFCIDGTLLARLWTRLRNASRYPLHRPGPGSLSSFRFGSTRILRAIHKALVSLGAWFVQVT